MSFIGTTGRYEPGRQAPRYSQRENQGRVSQGRQIGRQFMKESQHGQSQYASKGRPSQSVPDYEQSEIKHQDDEHRGRWKPKQRKETNIDDVFESDSEASEQTMESFDDNTIRKLKTEVILFHISLIYFFSVSKKVI